MPRLQDIFDTLYNAKYFSKMDVSNGFYSFKVAEEHKHKTAFITQDGIYQFIRVPQGMKNSPSFFNRILRKIFCNLLFKHVFLYLDDILCYGSTFDEHLTSLRLTFEKLRLNRLKLKASKCSFGYNELKLLGHVISKDGIKVDPSKVSAIKDMPIPRNVSEVRTYLGMTGYYRRFIKNYSILSRPLTELTRKDVPFQWTQSCQASFEILKSKLMTAPILSQFNEDLDVILYCDASLLGIGCVLAQRQNNEEKTIAYASRALTPTEYKWSIAERECLAVMFGLQRFHEYCYGRKITVVTDQHSLCSLLRTKNSKNLRIARWALECQSANITVKYRRGTLHGNADCLSRLVPLSRPSKGCESVFTTETASNSNMDYRNKIKLGYVDDKFFNTIIQILKSKNKLEISRLASKYVLYDDLLYYICPVTGYKKLCIPVNMINEILYAHHDNILGGGHVGIGRTYARVKNKYFIPKLKKHVARYVANCLKCAERQPDNRKKLGLLKTSEILNMFDKWQVDAIGPLKVTPRGYKYIITAVESLSNYSVTLAVKELNSITLANFLIRNIFLTFSVPKFIQFDNATVNKSKLIEELLKQVNCTPQFITPYQHHSSGKVERFNRSLEEILSKIIDTNQDNWDILLPIATYNLNCNINTATQYSPHFMVYGVHPNIPLDIALDLDLHSGILPKDKIILKAKQNVLKTQQRYIDSYNQRRSDDIIPIGTRIMLKRNVFTKGLSQKLQPKFFGPFRITKHIDRLRYRVKNLDENAKKKFQTVHVDRIKIIGKDIIEEDDGIELSSSSSQSNVKTPLKLLKRTIVKPKQHGSIQPPTTTYTSRFGRITNKPANYAK